MDFRTAAIQLLSRSTTVMLGTNGDDGWPHVQAIRRMQSEDLKTIWFRTFSSSSHVEQVLQDSRATIYLYEEHPIEGLALMGHLEVLKDPESRQFVWRDGDERFWPGGPMDPDFAALKFITCTGRYYKGLRSTTFEIQDGA